MKNYFFYIIFILILFSCSTSNKVQKNNDFHKYKVAYNYLLKNKYIDTTYDISDTIISNRLSYFSCFFCKIDKSKLNLNKYDTLPPPELLRVSRCNDSLTRLDRKNEIVPYYLPVKRVLNNFSNNSNYLIHFSKPVDNIVIVVVCQIKKNNIRIDCKYSHRETYYLKIYKGTIIEFYKQSFH